MKKMKQVLAVTAVVLLLGLYVCTLIFALMKGPGAGALFRGCLAATILLPVLLYAFILVYRRAKDKNRELFSPSDASETDTEKETE